jgi:hypothetical protein
MSKRTVKDLVGRRGKEEPLHVLRPATAKQTVWLRSLPSPLLLLSFNKHHGIALAAMRDLLVSNKPVERARTRRCDGLLAPLRASAPSILFLEILDVKRGQTLCNLLREAS